MVPGLPQVKRMVAGKPVPVPEPLTIRSRWPSSAFGEIISLVPAINFPAPKMAEKPVCIVNDVHKILDCNHSIRSETALVLKRDQRVAMLCGNE